MSLLQQRALASLSLLVIRSGDLERSRSFYGCLGLEFVREQHPRGPPHYAACLPGGLVFEIYPHTPGCPVGGIRVGLRVADPAAAVARLRSAGLLSGPATCREGDMSAMILDDPDGNTVELAPLAP